MYLSGPHYVGHHQDDLVLFCGVSLTVSLLSLQIFALAMNMFPVSHPLCCKFGIISQGCFSPWFRTTIQGGNTMPHFMALIILFRSLKQ